MKKLRNTKGITLIALVITIIVLLILAGVTITSLTGENGMLNRATEARDKTRRADLIERVRVEALGEQVENKNINLTNTKLQEILEKYFTNVATADLTKMDTTLIAKSEYGGFEDITLGELLTGEVKEKTVLKVEDTDLSTVSDISTMYGQTTDYKSISHPNIDWQLFYADASNYYVIASDYVPSVELPCNGSTVNGVKYGATDLVKKNEWNSNYCVAFCSSNSYNDGVLTAGTVYKAGSASVAITSNPLSRTYLKWASEYPNSTDSSICAVAYMLDTNKWSSFADGISGAYAIGGPTIEMYSLAWNAVEGHNQLMSYSTLTNSNSSVLGYRVENVSRDTQTSMWNINTQSNAAGYWLSSPSSNSRNGDTLISIGSTGYINGDYEVFNYMHGIRPLVSIPKERN